MSTTTVDNGNSMSCANCGKEGSNFNTCNKCELVKYCNAACKKKHRSKHKKKCDRRVAELHDEALFKQPPQEKECPICFLTLPPLKSGKRYMSCCGKNICSGCLHAGAMVGDDELCPFCRTPAPSSDKEAIERMNKRVQLGDAHAINNLGCDYAVGSHGFTQNWDKALELWHRSGELGCAKAYSSIGIAHDNSRGVERDEKKATYYYELAAMGGIVHARHNLGCSEGRAGNMDRALKHFMIAVGSGYHGSLKMIQQMCKNGQATRDDYSKALLAYQEYLSEIKSDQRDKAAASDEEYKYYE